MKFWMNSPSFVVWPLQSGDSMKKSPEQLKQDVALYLDQQGADLAVVKVMLQVLVWNLIRRDPNALNALGHLKNEVLASLYRTLTPPKAAGQGEKEVERMRQLTLIRAEKMFRDIEQTLGANNMDAKIMGAKSMNAKKQTRVSGVN